MSAQAQEALKHYFSQNGMLLCNKSVELPNLELVGGDWNAIVSLLESGDAFYSRLFQNRVTYLSSELYFAIKPYRRRRDQLDANSARLLAFLESAGEATAEQMQQQCMLEKKAQTEALNRLVYELYVTVLRRDVTRNETWCTFTYGISEHWEAKQPRENRTTIIGGAEKILLRQLSQKQVTALLR